MDVFFLPKGRNCASAIDRDMADLSVFFFSFNNSTVQFVRDQCLKMNYQLHMQAFSSCL